MSSNWYINLDNSEVIDFGRTACFSQLYHPQREMFGNVSGTKLFKGISASEVIRGAVVPTAKPVSIGIRLGYCGDGNSVEHNNRLLSSELFKWLLVDKNWSPYQDFVELHTQWPVWFMIGFVGMLRIPDENEDRIDIANELEAVGVPPLIALLLSERACGDAWSKHFDHHCLLPAMGSLSFRELNGYIRLFEGAMADELAAHNWGANYSDVCVADYAEVDRGAACYTWRALARKYSTGGSCKEIEGVFTRPNEVCSKKLMKLILE